MARLKAAKKSENGSGDASSEGLIRGAELEPMRVVRRELVSPSGSVVVVDVPVYPPFRLEGDRRRPGRAASESPKESGGTASG